MVQYTEYAMAIGETAPLLSLVGITIGGTTPVFYSSFGRGGGWRGFDHPYALDIAYGDSMKLGVNIVLYSMTH